MLSLSSILSTYPPMMLAGAVFCFGLIAGSFFNVLIYRLPRAESILWPGSRCPQCKKSIRFYENIPLFSYIFLKGRCARCKKSIPILYPAVELLTASILLILWFQYIIPNIQASDHWWEYITLAVQVLSLLILVPVSFIDLFHYIIPDSFSLGGLVTGLLVSFIPGGITPLESCIGAGAAGGILILIGLFGEYVLRKKDAMGGGDIKLMAFMGAVWGWKFAIQGIVLGALFGSVIGLLLILMHRMKKEQHIPFGPFLASGTFIAIFYGDILIQYYFSFIDSIIGL